MKKTVLTLLLPLLLGALELHQKPLHVTLDAQNGGKIDGSAWSSEMLKDKVHILFYVDPDEKDTNNALSDALKAEAFDRSKYASVAIINMAATWMPNFAIASSLEAKQEQFPHTTYVKDLNKVLVEKWNMADDSSNVLIFAPDGTLLHQLDGKADEKEIETIISLIKEHL